MITWYGQGDCRVAGEIEISRALSIRLDDIAELGADIQPFFLGFAVVLFFPGEEGCAGEKRFRFAEGHADLGAGFARLAINVQHVLLVMHNDGV